MKVSEIFLSIEGEGIRTGAPSVFIRLFGCNLRCSYCDSLYAIEGSDYKEMSVEQILESVAGYKANFVTVTGGEPLIHKDIEKLLNMLSESGYQVNVETNGTRNKLPLKNVFYTMDWKSISSSMQGKMDLERLMELDQNDVLKFVVGTVEDLQDASRVVDAMEYRFKANGKTLPTFYVSPVFNTMPYEDMVNWVLSNDAMRRNNTRFQVQLHKIIWDPNARGV